MEVKYCKCCNEILPIENFGKDKNTHDGYNYYCKPCCRAKQRKVRNNRTAEKNQKIQEYQKEYRANNQETIKETRQKWINENKEEYLESKKEDYRNRWDYYRQKGKEWNDNNRERKRIMDRLYYQNNKVEFLERYKEYYNRTKEQFKERRKEYYAKYIKTEHGRTIKQLQVQRRLAKKRQTIIRYNKQDWESCKAYFMNECAYCGKKTKKLEQEHFIALSKGGEYTTNNIIPACKDCNCSKSDKDFFQWYTSYVHYSKERERKILKYLNYNPNKIQQLKLI